MVLLAVAALVLLAHQGQTIQVVMAVLESYRLLTVHRTTGAVAAVAALKVQARYQAMVVMVEAEVGHSGSAEPQALVALD
jgi:hypothetical protein